MEGSQVGRPVHKIEFVDEESVDLVNPSYYKTDGGLQSIDVIEAFGLGFCEGNAIKYILRAGKKTADARLDIEKAIWYLQRHLKNLNEMIES